MDENDIPAWEVRCIECNHLLCFSFTDDPPSFGVTRRVTPAEAHVQAKFATYGHWKGCRLAPVWGQVFDEVQLKLELEM